jgi:hypothetical protein
MVGGTAGDERLVMTTMPGGYSPLSDDESYHQYKAQRARKSSFRAIANIEWSTHPQMSSPHLRAPDRDRQICIDFAHI